MNSKVKLFDVIYSKTACFIINVIVLLSYCYLNQVQGFHTLVEYLCYLMTITMFIIYILNGKYSSLLIVLAIYILFLCFSSVVGQYSSLIDCIKVYHKILFISMYIDLGIKENCKNIISGLYYSFAIIVLINFYTIIKYPNGLYADTVYTNNWFLKYDNFHIFFYFPTIALLIINNKNKNKKYNLFDKLVIIAITYSVYYCFSANTVVAYTLFIIYILFKKQIDKIKKFNSKNYFIVFLGIFLGIVILRMQNLFSWLIVDILGKNLTFTSRTLIWDRILELIKNKPIIGYGVETNIIMSMKLGNPHYTHAHNTILDVIYKGGFVSIIPFIMLLIIPIKELYNNKENSLSKTLSFIMLCILTMMNFEAREDKIGLYIILIICFNISVIIKNYNQESHLSK